MTSEALQNPYFVRLYCKNIDKTHSLAEPNDKIQFHGNYFFKKKGGGNKAIYTTDRFTWLKTLRSLFSKFANNAHDIDNGKYRQ